MEVTVKCNLYGYNSECHRLGLPRTIKTANQFTVESQEDLARELDRIWSESKRFRRDADAMPDGPYYVEFTSRLDNEVIVKQIRSSESATEIASILWNYPEA